MSAVIVSNSAFSVRELPYTPNAVLNAFAPFAATPWAMLLHSGFAEHPHNRFDIMTADPLATLSTCGQTTHIHAAGVTTCSSDDPLFILQDMLKRRLPTPAPRHDLPFCGGALGLWGYDLGRRFECLPQRSDRDVVTPDMAVGVYDWALIADHRTQKLFLLSHGDVDDRLRWLRNPPSDYLAEPFRLCDAWQANMTWEEYEARFKQVQHYIRAGDCYQINLTQRFSAPYRGDEWQAFLQLNRANRAPFSAYLRLPESTILSLSPERFLSLRQRDIATRPIKGTLPRLADAQEDARQAARLAASEKDRAENLMIVDLMRNDIGRVAAPGSVRVPELFSVEPFPAVHHLVSTITARLQEGLSAADLLRACFPGGSITGAPKIRAMEIIEELEPQRRNAYCGSIGYISCCGAMDTSIAIRTLIAEQNRLYCWAGGGIVADSHAAAEYRESFDKLAKILPILG